MMVTPINNFKLRMVRIWMEHDNMNNYLSTWRKLWFFLQIIRAGYLTSLYFRIFILVDRPHQKILQLGPSGGFDVQPWVGRMEGLIVSYFSVWICANRHAYRQTADHIFLYPSPSSSSGVSKPQITVARPPNNTLSVLCAPSSKALLISSGIPVAWMKA